MATQRVSSRDWSDYADAQADLSLRSAQIQACRKCCPPSHSPLFIGSVRVRAQTVKEAYLIWLHQGWRSQITLSSFLEHWCGKVFFIIINFVQINETTSENVPSDICAQRKFRDQPAHSRSLLRISPRRVLDSQGCKVSSCGQRRLWSTCRCSYMSPDQGLHCVSLKQGRIQVDFWGDSILLYYRTYSTYSDKQAWANSVDPNQTPQNAASYQGLHCLPLTQQFHTHEQVSKWTRWRDV